MRGNEGSEKEEKKDEKKKNGSVFWDWEATKVIAERREEKEEEKRKRTKKRKNYVIAIGRVKEGNEEKDMLQEGS